MNDVEKQAAFRNAIELARELKALYVEVYTPELSGEFQGHFEPLDQALAGITGKVRSGEFVVTDREMIIAVEAYELGAAIHFLTGMENGEEATAFYQWEFSNALNRFTLASVGY